MSRVSSEQISGVDVPGARARRGGSVLPGGVPAEAALQFAGMLAESRRRLEAARLAAAKESSREDAVRQKDARRECDELGGEGGRDFVPLVAQTASNHTAIPAQAAIAHASAGHGPWMRTGSEDAPDWLRLAWMLPAGVDDGVFEVLLPSRGKIGVALSDFPDGLLYRLAPEDEALAEWIRRHEMELEALLRQRIRRNVKVLVL